MKSRGKRQRVLCVVQSLFRLGPLQDAIRESGYEVLLAFTADHAVAACISSECDAVILDADLIRSPTSTLAETLKLARPNVPILLLDHREDPARKEQRPKGVDAAIGGRFPAEVLAGLATFLGEKPGIR
jgi:DNA-binding response OmpR family regulator